MLEIVLVWILMITATLTMWFLICDHQEAAKEEKRERAYYNAQILKSKPIEKTSLTPEDLLLLIELSEANHDEEQCRDR